MINFENYVHLLAPYLRNFKTVKPGYYNFSCPICGDSKKIKYKARGYIYCHNNHWFFKCFNCDYSSSISTFLKTYFSDIYNVIAFDDFSNYNKCNCTINEDLFRSDTVKRLCSIDRYAVSIDKLDDDNIAKLYALKRHIPTDKFKYLYYTEDFNTLCHNLGFDKNVPSDNRIVIPIYDIDHKLIGLQGRSLYATRHDRLRYVTLKVDTDNFVYGLDRVDINKNVYILEGPIDSLFLDNSLAIMSSALNEVCTRVPYLKKELVTLVFDNELKNREISLIAERSIKHGYKICIWPRNIFGKDINDMVLNGYSLEYIRSVIDNNTFNSLEALLRLKY